MFSPRSLLLILLLSLPAVSICAQVVLTDSDIPIIVINTNSQVIVDDPKIMADMGIIYNGPGVRNYMTDPFNNYNGKIGIELRGASSQLYHPKKSYGVELWDASGIERDTILLGMPKESDFCLTANYIDKSLLNNSLTYSLWQQMGHWGPRHQNVELVIDGNYQGVYLLTEKIKRDSLRVDISKLLPADTTGDQLTGGYIVTIDQQAGSLNYGWDSQYDAYGANGVGVYPHFICTYPDNGIMPQQAAYIHSYVDSFETALLNGQNDPLTGWQKYADINSFVDYFLVQEFSRNVDGYRASTYFYKDKQSTGGKLTMLVWDYDRGWGNASYAFGNDPAGWDWPFGDNYPIANPLQVPKWWDRFLQDTLFTKALRCRWEELRNTTLSVSDLHAYADSMAQYLNESQQRNFTKWPILGVLIFPNPSPVPTTYAGEIDELKTWITNRWNWLDVNIPGTAVNCNLVSNLASPNEKHNLILYPNPTSDVLTLQWDVPLNNPATISVADLTGKIVLESVAPATSDQLRLPVGDLCSGVYFVRIVTSEGAVVRKFIRQ
jgi:CotH kinase protein/Secretion system C-terminal sorting domain